MSQYGSLINHLVGNSKQPVIPVVGMGATKLLWSDRHAYTITRVSASGKTFWMKRDITKRIDKNGMSDSQQYEYETDETAPEERVNLSKDGRWKTSKMNVWIGVRDEHYDFSF